MSGQRNASLRWVGHGGRHLAGPRGSRRTQVPPNGTRQEAPRGAAGDLQRQRRAAPGWSESSGRPASQPIDAPPSTQLPRGRSARSQPRPNPAGPPSARGRRAWTRSTPGPWRPPLPRRPSPDDQRVRHGRPGVRPTTRPPRVRGHLPGLQQSGASWEPPDQSCWRTTCSRCEPAAAARPSGRRPDGQSGVWSPGGHTAPSNRTPPRLSRPSWVRRHRPRCART